MQRIEAPIGIGKAAATLVVLFFVSLLMARLLIQGDWAWTLFLVLLPLVLVLLVALLGFTPALVGAAFFACATLGLRWVLIHVGWTAILLAPVIAFTALLGYRVIRRLSSPATHKGGDEGR